MHSPNMVPTFETIKPALVQINANATSSPTTASDGTVGHLVLAIVQVAYQDLSFSKVNHPPPLAPLAVPNFPTNSTGAHISESWRTFDKKVRTFTLYHSVDSVLKQQLLSSIDDKYAKVHNNRNTGYTHVTTRTLIGYLLQTYGQITPNDLINNEECMK